MSSCLHQGLMGYPQPYLYTSGTYLTSFHLNQISVNWINAQKPAFIHLKSENSIRAFTELSCISVSGKRWSFQGLPLDSWLTFLCSINATMRHCWSEKSIFCTLLLRSICHFSYINVRVILLNFRYEYVDRAKWIFVDIALVVLLERSSREPDHSQHESTKIFPLVLNIPLAIDLPCLSVWRCRLKFLVGKCWVLRMVCSSISYWRKKKL